MDPRVISATFSLLLSISSTLTAQSAQAAWKPSDPDITSLKSVADNFGDWPATGPRIAFASKRPDEMPNYDRLVFYRGPEGDPIRDTDAARLFLWIWRNRDERSSPGFAQKQSDALLLAAMDSGVAGPRWKQLYDESRRRDEDMPRRITDRFQNRHALLASINARLGASKSPQTPVIAKPDPQIDELASRVSEDEIRQLFAAYSRIVYSIETRNTEIPAGQYAAYMGKNAEGRYEV